MSPSATAPTQHRSVGAPIKAVPSNLIPKAGAVAIVPADHPTRAHYVKELTERVPSATLTDAVDDKTSGVIWLDIAGPPAAARLGETLDKFSQVGWVQLPQAGINNFAVVIKKHNQKVWTSAKGSFGQPVAEHALLLALALLRNIPKRIRATSWGTPNGISLFGRSVTILGAGGITTSLLSLLAPFDVNVTVLRRRAEPLDPAVVPPQLEGRIKCESFTQLHSVLPSTEVLFLAAALTPETHGIIGAKELSLLPSHGVLVNVARGEHVQTDALVEALRKGTIAGAGIDVTAPEPLPADHPLWSLTLDKDAHLEEELTPDSKGNLIITPHTADTPAMVTPLLVLRFATNAKALLEGKGFFEGVVDTEHAY